MSDSSHKDQGRDYRSRVRPRLDEAGFSNSAIEALFDIDAENFQFVRRVMKGDIPQSLMDELATDLEVTQFHALSALMRIKAGFGRSMPEEPTVGLLAEEMCLDPSRASRIAADLVERGLVQRAASQQDGRRSILVPTETAIDLIAAFLRAKWERTIRLFAEWPEEDILAFARLFGRYSEGLRTLYPREENRKAE